MCNRSIFGARTSHGQTWIHKTHHVMNLGEITTFPLIVFSMSSHRTNTQMSFFFVVGFPSWSPKILEIGTPTTLGACNFFCKLQIEMKSKAKF
jgi:hypothetical protein